MKKILELLKTCTPRDTQAIHARMIRNMAPGEIKKWDLQKWEHLILRYYKDGVPEKGIATYTHDLHPFGYESGYIFESVVQSSNKMRDHLLGSQFHGLIAKSGFQGDERVQQALCRSYILSDNMPAAEMIFNEMEMREIGLWNDMIGSYIDQEQFWMVHRLHKSLRATGYPDPDERTLSMVIASTDWITFTETMQSYIYKSGLRSNFAMSSLISSYGREGKIKEATKVFDEIEDFKKGTGTFNCLMSCHIDNGSYTQVLKLWEDHGDRGLQPDEVTSVLLMEAYSHLGLIEKGIEIYNMVERDLKIVPNMRHNGLLVDLYARASRYDEAIGVIGKLAANVSDVDVLWRLLANRASENSNHDLAAEALEKIIHKEDIDNVNLSNAYTSVGKFSEAKIARDRVKGKPTGTSLLIE